MTSDKRQATSDKQQATSDKRQDGLFKRLLRTDTGYDLVYKILFVLVFGVFIFVNISSNFTNILYKPFILMFIVSVITVFFLFKVSETVSNDKIAIFLVCTISLFVLVGWNLIYKPLPVSDYEVIWNGAHQIINGNFYERASNKSDYFYFFNFQIPYTYYVSLWLRIYDSLITIKIVEIVTLSLTNLVFYKILGLFLGIKESLFGALLFATFPYIFIGSGIINNHHIGLLLGALAVYVLLREGNYLKYILSALLLVVGNLLRPSMFMMFIAVAFVLLIQGLLEKKKLLGLLVFLGVFLVANELINFAFIWLSLAPVGIKSSDLYFKLLIGLTGSGVTKTPTTDAEHTYLYYDLLYYNFDYAKYKEVSREYLMNKIMKGQLDYNYILTKIKTFVSGIDNQYLYGDLQFNNTNKPVMECLNFGGWFIYVFTLIAALFYTLRQRIIVKNHLLFNAATFFK